jgi:hypothetical protein
MYKASVFVIDKNILLTLTNTQALNITELITAVKSFMMQPPPRVHYFEVAFRLLHYMVGSWPDPDTLDLLAKPARINRFS